MPNHDPPAPEGLTGYITVDAIEGKVVRVELPDGSTAHWDLASLPRDIQEGDVVRLHVEHGDLELEIDPAETHRRRNEAQKQLLSLNRNAPTGDLDL
ncbi:DUF3006 domain-containing protein [Deinococcus sp. S9]|uniref:DUF3006 domain-containing protein n=1 Tax=Deinococcus sp. S9 TaxID=2545754 RepID=UPI0010557500|nr:DUF3006 domain-containing protein [Deinococcus sp. S9]TDE85045.1 DUF3006 domain-containing protein [Deinococcus sp. S9]